MRVEFVPSCFDRGVCNHRMHHFVSFIIVYAPSACFCMCMCFLFIAGLCMQGRWNFGWPFVVYCSLYEVFRSSLFTFQRECIQQQEGIFVPLQHRRMRSNSESADSAENDRCASCCGCVLCVVGSKIKNIETHHVCIWAAFRRCSICFLLGAECWTEWFNKKRKKQHFLIYGDEPSPWGQHF